MASRREERLEAAWLPQRDTGSTEMQGQSRMVSHAGGQKHCVLERPTPCGTLCGFLLWPAGSIWKILQALPGPPAPCCLWTVIAQNLNWGLHLTPTLRAESCRFPAQPRPARPPPHTCWAPRRGRSQVGLASFAL